MTSPPGRAFSGLSYRSKLMLAMTVVFCGITLLGLTLAERRAAREVEEDLRRAFEAEVRQLRDLHAVRQDIILERCRVLARKARIRAALEDGALDLLYPSAHDELRDVLLRGDDLDSGAASRATFYRFLDRDGRVLPSPPELPSGVLSPAEARQLLPAPHADGPQVGYLWQTRPPSAGLLRLLEVYAMPIRSSDDDRALATLVLGFPTRALVPGETHPGAVRQGIWVDGTLLMPGLAAGDCESLERALRAPLGDATLDEGSLQAGAGGMEHRVFFRRLNPGSVYKPAFEVCMYSNGHLRERKNTLRWQAVGLGGLMILVGLGASHLLAGGFSKPMQRLADDSAAHRQARQRAEAALEMTQEELERAARFSANASHQLKTPVSVVRAGLEEMLAADNLTAAQREELACLVHQTGRLNAVIEDLLLLSRMDAGRLRLDLRPFDLTQLLEALLDDLSALPDPHGLTVTTDIPPNLQILGEKRYTTLILQNLLENARAYNRAGGRIDMRAYAAGDAVFFHIGNTGQPIPVQAQAHLFERFHRAGLGENIPGHGLGLNLASELARLHGGALSLVRSFDDLTEFVVTFRLATLAGPGERG